MFGATASLGRAKPPWRVFYQGAKIIITSRYVEVDGMRIAVSELRDMERCLTYRYPLVKVAAVTAGLELAIAVPLAVIYGSVAMLCVGLISACGMALGAWGDSRRNPRQMEIRATLRGQRVVLFGSGNHQEFGHVWRALVRAAEDNRQPTP